MKQAAELTELTGQRQFNCEQAGDEGDTRVCVRVCVCPHTYTLTRHSCQTQAGIFTFSPGPGLRLIVFFNRTDEGELEQRGSEKIPLQKLAFFSLSLPPPFFLLFFFAETRGSALASLFGAL